MNSNRNTSRHPRYMDTRPIPRTAAEAARRRHVHTGPIVRAGHGTETIHCEVCLTYVTKEV